jgi:DNA-binding NtrC family response regulator
VPTILLVGNGDKDARRAAYEYGVYNVIEKPIDPVSYLCIVRNALSMQVMRRNDATRAMAVVDQYKVLQAQIHERKIAAASSTWRRLSLISITNGSTAAVTPMASSVTTLWRPDSRAAGG